LNRKLIALVVAASSSGVLGGLALAPAHATTVPVSTPVGTLTLSGDPTTQQGSVILQGNGAVPGPVGHGYIGVTSANGGEVVGCGSGTYDDSAADSNGTTSTDHNKIVGIPPSTSDLSGLESAGSSPCTP
jgi:hypothetical protein